MKLNVGKKLSLGFIILIILMASLGTYSIISLGKVNNDLTDLYDMHLKEIEYIKDAEVNLISIGRARSNMILATNMTEKKQHAENMGILFGEFENNIEECNKTLIGQDAHDSMMKISSLWAELKPDEEKAIELALGNADQLAHSQGIQNRAMADEVELEIMRLANIKDNSALDAYNDGDAQFNRTRNITIILIVISMVIGLLTSYYMSSIIARPIVKIADTIKEVADGDLSIEEVSVKNMDEIGELAESLNTMINSLRSVVGGISGASQQVAATSQELSASSEETTSATEEIASAMNELATGSSQQAKDASEMSTVVGQMVSNMEDIMNNVNTVSKISENVSLESITGLDKSEIAIEKIQKIKQVTEESVGIVRILGDESIRIGEIVEVIRGISDQTNLLALNAAIEAARAGEHGSGFAVVADEVRKLAEQSSSSALEIAELIARIQSETQSVVEVMDIATNEVSEGVDAVNETGIFFNAISGEINDINNGIQQVSTAVEEMTNGSQFLDSNMEGIAAIAQEAAASSEEVSAASEEQAASMVEIANASQELAELAELLQENVSTFII